MKLLIITQAVDLKNPILGFFHRWIEEFSKHFESIIVICLFEGEHNLPENVKVLSLGKEKGESRLKYIWNFYKYIWQERKNYDKVFVHMNSIYINLGFNFWSIWGKKTALWFNHTYGKFSDRLAFLLANKLFHTSPFAFSAGREKSVRMPAGIDMDRFKINETVEKIPNSVLFIGRISAVKKIDVLIKAVSILNKEGIDCKLDIYGGVDKGAEDYFEKLKSLSTESFGKIVFHNPVPNTETPHIYNSHQVFVNLTPKGNYDKTVLEAMACGTPALVSSEAFRGVVPNELFFKEENEIDLANKIKSILLGDTRLDSSSLRDSVLNSNSLGYLSNQIKLNLSQ